MKCPSVKKGMAVFLGCICIVAFGLIFLTGCREKSTSVNLDLSKKEQSGTEHPKHDGTELRVAVGGMITPKEGFGYYRKFLDYIGEKMGLHVDFVDREDYAEINKLVKTGNVDMAFVCGGPYVAGKREFNMELLAAPEAYGGTVYYSYIIVHKDSPAKDLKDLKGRHFAFTDPMSNTGKMVPTAMLAKMGQLPETFFSKVTYTKKHDNSIKAVAERLVDGAAVDSLIWEYAQRKNPEFSSKTKVIVKSDPYGIPPVVVRSNLSADKKDQLRRILLEAHKDPKGAEILSNMMITRFVAIDDHAYDSIRELETTIARAKAKAAK